MQALATIVQAPRADHLDTQSRPAAASLLRRVVNAVARHIERCQAARLAKVERIVRAGLSHID